MAKEKVDFYKTVSCNTIPTNDIYKKQLNFCGYFLVLESDSPEIGMKYHGTKIPTLHNFDIFIK